MNQIVPAPLLFDYRLTIPPCAPPGRKKTGRLLSLPANARLPDLSPLGQSSLDQSPPFAAIYVGWNPSGLALAVHVAGKRIGPQGNRDRLISSDAVEFWIDTRPTGNVARATQYCHRLACLPVDELADDQPAVISLPIPQQRETKIEIDVRKISLRCRTTKSGYEIEAWIPESQLYGFRQIEELRRLGFYCVVRDTELGEQPLTVSSDFPFAWNPTLWVTLELAT